VRDHALEQSRYLLAPLGSMLGDSMERTGLSSQGHVLRAGNLLRDVRVSADITIGGGELLFHSGLPQPASAPDACIRCGWCVDACPTNVHPATALEAAQQSDIDLAESSGVEACIECGICSYVCPSHLPLLEGIRRIKQMLRDELGAKADV
jgi:electron transport complex protein RnfC